MTKRPKQISLAPIPSLTRAAAERALRKFSDTGHRRPEGPTPERLLQADGAAVIETFSEVVEISRGDKFEATPVDLNRIRCEDSTLAKLRARSLLSPGKTKAEAGMNMVYFQAGSKYYELWYRAGLQPLGAAPIEPVVPSGFSSKCFFRSEAQVIAFDDFREARRAMAQEFAAVVDDVVLRDNALVNTGRRVCGIKQRQSAGAVGLFALQGGLRQLAYHFKLLSHSDAPKGVSQ